MDPRKDALNRPGGIAARLLAMRRRAGIAAKDLAAAAGWHPAKVSRIENGRQMPSPADVRAWGDATHAPDDVVRGVLALLGEANADYQDWRLSMRRGQAAVQVEHTQLVDASTRIVQFETTAVPGLLQTAAYAEPLFRWIYDVNRLDVDDVPAALAERLQRQQALYDSGKTFEFLLCEPVLRWVFVPAAAMRAQLDRLQTVIGLANVRFGIIPLGVRLTEIPMTSLGLYFGDETVSLVETPLGEQKDTGITAQRYAEIVTRLWADAVEGDEARALITAAARPLNRLLHGR